MARRETPPCGGHSTQILEAFVYRARENSAQKPTLPASPRKCTESDKSLRQPGTGIRLDSSLRGCLIRWVFYLFLFTKDGTEYLFNETGNGRNSENNQLPQFRQQAGLESHRAGSAGD